MTKRVCSIEGCDRPHYARGWCEMHYRRWKQHGDPTTYLVRTRAEIGCAVDGCERPHGGRGWCELHLDRWRRNGDPLHTPPGPLARILAAIVVDEATGCWRCPIGVYKGLGYSYVSVDGRREPTHRFMYKTLVGPIPEGLELDHVWERGCRYRDCANVDHLEPVTKAENIRRGDSASAVHARKTHCPNGHPYDMVEGATRRCKQCRQEQAKARASS